MDKILLRPCSYKDFYRILPIIEAYSNIFNFHDKRFIIRETSKALDEAFAAKTVYIALSDGQLVGFLGGRRNNNNPLRLDLFCIVVKRGYDGMGIGSQLFQHACQELVKYGFTEVHAKLKSTYPPHTKRFYQKLGFKQTFDEDYTGSSADDTAMVLKLNTKPVQPSDQAQPTTA